MVTWLLATPRESLLIWLRGGKKQLFTEPEGAWAAVRGLCAGLVQAGQSGAEAEGLLVHERTEFGLARGLERQLVKRPRFRAALIRVAALG